MTQFSEHVGFRRDQLEFLIKSGIELRNGKNRRKAARRKIGSTCLFQPIAADACLDAGRHLRARRERRHARARRNSWTLEHRRRRRHGRGQDRAFEGVCSVLERYVSAIGVRTFAELKNWYAERKDPILCAFAITLRADHQSRVGNAPSLPGDGGHDDDPRKIRSGEEKGAFDLGVAPEAAADGRAEQFRSGGCTDRPRSADSASERIRAGR